MLPSAGKLKKLVERRAALIAAQKARPLADDEKQWLKEWSGLVDKALQQQELRAHARVATDVVCTLSTDEGPLVGRVQNLSLLGALVSAPPGFAELGDTLAIEVETGSAVPLSVLGDVVRVEDRGTQARYALRFAVVEPKQRDELRRFIESLTAKR